MPAKLAFWVRVRAVVLRPRPRDWSPSALTTQVTFYASNNMNGFSPQPILGDMGKDFGIPSLNQSTFLLIYSFSHEVSITLLLAVY